jgi:hypothetical protein
MNGAPPQTAFTRRSIAAMTKAWGRRKARSPDADAIGIRVGSVLRERYCVLGVAGLFPLVDLVPRPARRRSGLAPGASPDLG